MALPNAPEGEMGGGAGLCRSECPSEGRRRNQELHLGHVKFTLHPGAGVHSHVDGCESDRSRGPAHVGDVHSDA